MKSIYKGIILPNRPDPQNVQRLDLACLPLIAEMEKNGLGVDKEYMTNLHTQITREMEDLNSQVTKLTGYSINLGSGDQLADLLFKKLRLKQQGKEKMTKSKTRLAADSDVLRGMISQHPSIPVILQWKQREKLRAGFTLSLISQADEHNRIHCDLNHTGPETGRLSCSSPNLQTIPIRTKLGREVRNAFIPKPGNVYGTVDACLHPDTLVKSLNGDKKISELIIGEPVLACRDKRITYGKVVAKTPIAPKISFRITFDNGESVIASHDHRWPVYAPRKKVVVKITYQLVVGERMIPCRKGRGAINKQGARMITKIEPMGMQPMYAITVEPDHNYVLACGVVTMNSQIEMRTMAHDSYCKGMLEIFWHWEDLYWGVAEGMYERKFSEEERKHGIDPESGQTLKNHYRFNAKTTALGVTYDISPEGLVDLFLTAEPPAIHYLTKGDKVWSYDKHYVGAVGVCTKAIRDFFSAYPEILTRRREHHRRARKYGYVWDMWGRIRWIPQVMSTHNWIVGEGLRAAGNLSGQGGAAGIIKLWMAKMWDRLEEYWRARGILILLAIHDEILVEGPKAAVEDWLEEAKYLLRNLLLDPDLFCVPLEADSDVGDRWGALK